MVSWVGRRWHSGASPSKSALDLHPPVQPAHPAVGAVVVAAMQRAQAGAQEEEQEALVLPVVALMLHALLHRLVVEVVSLLRLGWQEMQGPALQQCATLACMT